MSNKATLAEIVTRWSRPMLRQVLGVKLGQNETFNVVENTIRKWFPVSASYSLMNDIDFAVNAIAGAKVKSAVVCFIDNLGIEDCAIPDMAREFVNGWLEKCDNNGGSVTLFENIVLERKDLDELVKFIEASF